MYTKYVFNLNIDKPADNNNLYWLWNISKNKKKIYVN